MISRNGNCFQNRCLHPFKLQQQLHIHGSTCRQMCVHFNVTLSPAFVPFCRLCTTKFAYRLILVHVILQSIAYTRIWWQFSFIKLAFHPKHTVAQRCPGLSAQRAARAADVAAAAAPTRDLPDPTHNTDPRRLSKPPTHASLLPHRT